MKVYLRFIAVLVSCLIVFSVKGKKDDAPIPKYYPEVGLGVGMLKFYGDIMSQHRGNPLIGAVGYKMYINQPINDYLSFKFHVLYGNLNGNEYSGRRLNFRSKIATGAFMVQYNFWHVLPENPRFHPYIASGISSVEFHSKTDLMDGEGNRYHYWTDGQIRDIAQDAPDADQSKVIQRDYNYETDLRELNSDDLGKYPERTFAVPLEIGFKFPLAKQLYFGMHSSMYFTFSDLLDNVTGDSKNDMLQGTSGTSGNDKFLYTGFTFNYNFGKLDVSQLQFIDSVIPPMTEHYLVDGALDEDGDGVDDFNDYCPNTPSGVAVTEWGCPEDNDEDFVPNYLDEELETAANAPVDTVGVTIPDSLLELAQLMYLDSTGDYHSESHVKRYRSKGKSYRIYLGEFTEDVPDDFTQKLLGVRDLQVENKGGRTVFSVEGSYDKLTDAVDRRMRLEQRGISSKVMEKEKRGNGEYVEVSPEALKKYEKKMKITSKEDLKKKFYRIQLGAFSKRVTDGVIAKLGKKKIEIKGSDGLYKYLYNKVYTDLASASKDKIMLMVDHGIKDAFVVAYKDGSRTTIKRTAKQTKGELSGAIPFDPVKEGYAKPPVKNNIKLTEDGLSIDDFKSEGSSSGGQSIVYKVELGVYKGKVGINQLNSMLKLDGGVAQKTHEEGTQYLSKDFNSFYEANNFFKKLNLSVFPGAKVIMLKDGKEAPLNK